MTSIYWVQKCSLINLELQSLRTHECIQLISKEDTTSGIKTHNTSQNYCCLLIHHKLVYVDGS